MSSARARTQTARSGLKRTNHEASAPPRPTIGQRFYLGMSGTDPFKNSNLRNNSSVYIRLNTIVFSIFNIQYKQQKIKKVIEIKQQHLKFYLILHGAFISHVIRIDKLKLSLIKRRMRVIYITVLRNS